MTEKLNITLIGGPTALIEIGGFRLLTDPTFDEPGDYQLPHVVLKKTTRPALRPDELGAIDAVLLSHDQHADNLDNSGRAELKKVPRVLTTEVGAKRLGGNAEGLAPWQETELAKASRRLRVIAAPARHGPAGIEPFAGDVVGFVLSAKDQPTVYVTGDTVFYAGVAEVARRFPADVVLLFAGAAQTRGPFHLTMNTNDAIETAAAFPRATIVPVHYEGWAHFSQGRAELEAAFKALGFAPRLQLLEPGMATPIRFAERASA